jgi:hypothetical protein
MLASWRSLARQGRREAIIIIIITHFREPGTPLSIDNRVKFPEEAGFFISSSSPDWLWSPPIGTALSPRGGGGAGHSPPSSAARYGKHCSFKAARTPACLPTCLPAWLGSGSSKELNLIRSTTKWTLLKKKPRLTRPRSYRNRGRCLQPYTA